MCYMLYIGSDGELPLIPEPDWETIREDWPSQAPQLFIRNLQESEKVVKRHFSEKKVAYAGSFEKCGCGFNQCSLEDLPYQEDEEIYLSQKSRKALHDYIQKHRISTLYGCQDGEQSENSGGDVNLTLETLLDPKFSFPEKVRMALTFD